MILDGFEDRPMAPELVKAFIAEFHAEINRQRADQDAVLDLERHELDRIGRKHAGLVDVIAEDLRTEGLLEKLEVLESRKLELAVDIANSPGPRPRPHPNLAELYRLKVANLGDALGQPETRSEALDIPRSVISAVVVSPTGGGFEIELSGDNTNMIKLPEGSSIDRHRSSVKLVAGTYNNHARNMGELRIIA
jgi:hypothetical protein